MLQQTSWCPCKAGRSLWEMYKGCHCSLHGGRGASPRHFLGRNQLGLLPATGYLHSRTDCFTLCPGARRWYCGVSEPSSHTQGQMIHIMIGSTIAVFYISKHMESRNQPSVWEPLPGIPRAEWISVRAGFPLQVMATAFLVWEVQLWILLEERARKVQGCWEQGSLWCHRSSARVPHSR